MKVVKDEPAQRQVVLTVELEASELEPYLHQAYRRLVQRVAVPGFRKGKVPRSILERVVGREALLDEALENLVPEVTGRAIKAQELEISAQPQVEVLQLDPVTLKATVPLLPEVDLGNYTALRVYPPSVTIQEDEIDKALLELRRGTAPWEPVDRPAEMEYLLVMDLVGSTQSEPVIKQTDVSYILNPDPKPVPGFGEALVGIRSGETRVFTLKFDKEHQESKLADQECEFTVVAKDIKEQILPALDDEFAKSVGSQGFETLEELQEDIRQHLKESQEREAKRIHEIDVVQRVIQEARVELPPLLIEREIDHLMEDMKDEARRSGNSQADVDEYISNLNKSPDQMRESLRHQALERLNREAVLMQIAREEKVQAPDEAVEEEIAQMIQDAGEQGEQMRQLFSQPRARDSLARSILGRRTVQRIAAIAQGDEGIPAFESGSLSEVVPSVETPEDSAKSVGSPEGNGPTQLKEVRSNDATT